MDYFNYQQQYLQSIKLDPGIIVVSSLLVTHIHQSLRSVVLPLQMLLEMWLPLRFLTPYPVRPNEEALITYF